MFVPDDFPGLALYHARKAALAADCCVDADLAPPPSPPDLRLEYLEPSAFLRQEVPDIVNTLTYHDPWTGAHLPGFDGLLLDTNGFVQHDNVLHLHVCKPCLRALEVGKLPARAIANDNWMGQPLAGSPIAQDFDSLTWAERQLIAINRTRICLQLRGSYKDKDMKQRGARGNAISHKHDSEKICEMLPRPVESLCEVIKVIFVSNRPCTANDLKWAALCDLPKVVRCFEWLQLNHPSYAHIQLHGAYQDLDPNMKPFVPPCVLVSATDLPDDTTADGAHTNTGHGNCQMSDDDENTATELPSHTAGSRGNMSDGAEDDNLGSAAGADAKTGHELPSHPSGSRGDMSDGAEDDNLGSADLPSHTCGSRHRIGEACPGRPVQHGDMSDDAEDDDPASADLALSDLDSEIEDSPAPTLPLSSSHVSPMPTSDSELVEPSDQPGADLPPPAIYLNGIVDLDVLHTTSAQIRTAALENLVKGVPTMAVPHSANPISTFTDPDAWVCSYPMLYPRGVGGPPIATAHSTNPDRTCVRRTKLSSEMYFRHCLNLHDSGFARDPGWMFVAQNDLQIKAMLRSARTTTTAVDPENQFLLITEALINECFKKGPGAKSNDVNVNRFLQCLRSSGGQVKGTDQERLKWRQWAHAFNFRFGVATVWCTFAPSDQHNPIVAYIAGEKIDMDAWVPEMPCSRGRLRMLAQNPVAQTKFFHLFTHAFIDAMLGWDFDTHQSRVNEFPGDQWKDSSIATGGVLGDVEAFFAPGSCPRPPPSVLFSPSHLHPRDRTVTPSHCPPVRSGGPETRIVAPAPSWLVAQRPRPHAAQRDDARARLPETPVRFPRPQRVARFRVEGEFRH